MSMSTAPQASDADPRIKDLVVVLLRAGLGVHLLNDGVLAYLRLRAFGPAVNVQNIHSALPVLQIVLGLAVILGIFTTAATLAAGLFILANPLVQTAILAGGGAGPAARGPWGLVPFSDQGSASQLLMAAAVLWFSTPGRNPWSLDRMVFPKRVAPARQEAARRREPIDLPAAPPPGEKTARFLAGRDSE